MSGGASALFVETRDRSALGGIDARVRLVACLVLLLCLPLLDRPAALAAALLLALAFTIAARLPARLVRARLLVAEGFLVALLVTLPFVIPGQPIFSWFWLTASWEGLWRAVTIVARVNAGVLIILVLIGGLGSARLAGAMTGIGVPPRLAQLLQMTVRYVELFSGEYQRLRRAMRVRGFRAGSNRHSWRSFGNVLGMLVVRSIERAERVQWAMVCRGFAGRFPAAAPDPLTGRDARFATCCVLALLVLFALEYWT